MFPGWSKIILQQLGLHRFQAFLLLGSIFIPPKFRHSSVKVKGLQIHLLDVHPTLAHTGDLPLAIPVKLQWDEYWLKSQIPESVLLIHSYSGNQPFQVRFFSIGNRRDCSSTGRRWLRNPFTALGLIVHFKNPVSLILVPTKPQVYPQLQSLNQKYPVLLAGRVHISPTCSFL